MISASLFAWLLIGGVVITIVMLLWRDYQDRAWWESKTPAEQAEIRAIIREERSRQ